MKPFIILLILVGNFLFSSLSQAQDKLDPNDPAVQGSYAIGANTGMRLRELLSSLKDTDFVLYNDAVISGLIDGFEGNNRMDDQLFDASMQWFNENAGKAIKKKQSAITSDNKEEAEVNLKASVDFLHNNKSKEGIVTLPSGLQYKILKAGSGLSPTVGDRVTINYVGRLTDGAEFDSTYKRQRPTTLRLDRAIKGWQEALKLMKKGAKWRVFIPPRLGFGEQKYEGVPANSVLIFDLELLDVIQGNKAQ